MANLNTTYLGIPLKNPLVAASSGFTASVNKIKTLEAHGIGAIVLKSIFEEQITNRAEFEIDQSGDLGNPEAADYIKGYIKDNEIEQYLDLIKETKESVNIPVIASINCISGDEWINYAHKFENAGADALELNIFNVPGRTQSLEAIESLYTTIAERVVNKVNIPVAVKFSKYHTNITKMVDQFRARGIKGVVMFNRFYEPDFNLDKLTVTSSEVFSHPYDLRETLRWVGIVSSSVPLIDIAASTGIHDADAVVKQLLAGAQVTQLCSTLYLNKVGVIDDILKGVEEFMTKHKFKSIDDFRAKLSYQNIGNPAMYERAQFMKYFHNRENIQDNKPTISYNPFQ
ncbi:MAG: diguanylate cyclase [Flavobacteriia bacterium]|nr:MAG: diguanylate cyclase [Flavobacteriia bacterium]